MWTWVCLKKLILNKTFDKFKNILTNDIWSMSNTKYHILTYCGFYLLYLTSILTNTVQTFMETLDKCNFIFKCKRPIEYFYLVAAIMLHKVTHVLNVSEIASFLNACFKFLIFCNKEFVWIDSRNHLWVFVPYKLMNCWLIRWHFVLIYYV